MSKKYKYPRYTLNWKAIWGKEKRKNPKHRILDSFLIGIAFGIGVSIVILIVEWVLRWVND